MKTKIISIVVIIILIALVAFKLTSNKKVINENNKTIDRSEIPVAVTIYNVKKMPISGNVTRPSLLEPKDEASVAVGVGGKLESLRVELGSKVSKGQIIGTVDTKVMKVNVRSLELTVSKLKRDYDRNSELLKGNAISENAVTDSKFSYETKQLELAQLKQQIADANIIAPISGVVVVKNLVPGEFVSPGVEVVKIADVNTIKTNVYVNESEVYQLKMNQSVNLTASVFPGKKITGVISYISPRADDNHNYKVEVMVSKKEVPELKAGTYVNVSFNTQKETEVLQIPKRSLVEGTKNPYVYIIENQKAIVRKIVIGRESGENIEVISGLKEGDVIVSDGQINLISGSNVEVKNIKK
ncbi:MAG: efflux RND transporter periplasmic adaptor subunit [Crocinitomicaceae bacterium]|nr:efflux RND transporter periplasmic adaptor subunit [Crocinitomicaceae bacterium]